MFASNDSRACSIRTIGCLAAFLALACLCGSPAAQAQIGTASINGVVRDASGSVIPEAQIELRNLGTNVIRTTVTNRTGAYALVNVPPGRYSLAVSKKGFATATQENIALRVDQTTSFDFSLQVGEVTQTVTVISAGGALETSTTGLGTAVSNRTIGALPLNGRNFTQLLSQTPGVSGVNVSQNKAGSDISTIGSFSFPAVNGQTNRSNIFLIDGLNDIEAVRDEYAVPPILDDIEEFKVDSHNDLPQFGGSLGGTVNIVTKSGTNDYHGTGWEFLRNTFADARNPLTGLSSIHQNQFGANLGGPVRVPFYDGRDHTFFFLGYEGFRLTQPGSTFYVVPTSAELAGDFSAISTELYNPFTTAPDPAHPGQYTRTQFSGNNIAAALDPNMVAVAKAIYPAPMQTRLANYNGLDTTPNDKNSNAYEVRIDEQLGPRDAVWARFSHIEVPASGTGGFENILARTYYQGHVGGANWTHTFGADAFLHLSFSRDDGRDLQETVDETVNPVTLIQQANLSPLFACNLPDVPGSCMLPNFQVVGYASGGGNYVNRHLSNIWELRGDFSYLLGRHLLSAGADFNTTGFDEPIVVINDEFEAQQTGNLEHPAGTGNALASFLLGVPYGASRRGLFESEYGGWEDGFYVQDQWKATDRFTANFGFRYGLTLKPIYGSQKNGNQYVGDLDLSNGTYILAREPAACGTAAPCIPGGQLPANVVVTANSNGAILSNNYNNAQPRLGLAYRIDPRTVLHAAFGIAFENWAGIAQQAQSYAGTWPSITQISNTNLNASTVAVTAENPLAQTNGLPAATPWGQVEYYVDPHISTPYAQQWNLGLQRQITPTTVAAANYVGSHGVHLDLGYYANTAQTPGPGNAATVASRRPYPYITPTIYETGEGGSSYDALQLSVDRRSSSGLSFMASYTWSKSMDLGCSGFFSLEGCAVENPYNMAANWSVSSFDLTNILTANWVYQLPFGHGQRFSTGNRLADYVIGGWGINGFLTLTSGIPYYTCIPGDIANTGNSGNGSPGNCYERLNVVGDPRLANPSIKEWFNKTAFAVPANYTFGDEGRNSLRADGYKDLDASVFREFPLGEERRVEFRAEAFNLTNTPSWGTPDGNYSDSTFGQVSATQTNARELQFALKVYF